MLLAVQTIQTTKTHTHRQRQSQKVRKLPRYLLLLPLAMGKITLLRVTIIFIAMETAIFLPA